MQSPTTPSAPPNKRMLMRGVRRILRSKGKLMMPPQAEQDEGRRATKEPPRWNRGYVLCGSRSKVATGMPMNVTFRGVKEGLNILKFTAA
jgi:hypothetical protein